MADILDFGPKNPRRNTRPWTIVGAIVLAAAVGTGIYLNHPGGPSTPDAVDSPRPSPIAAFTGYPDGEPAHCPDITLDQDDSLVGVAVSGVGAGAGRALERCDKDAVTGPWSTAIRAADGSLGTDGAVITYPVDPPKGGHAITSDHYQVWKVPDGEGYAEIRGDLGRAELTTLAKGTTIVSGRPVPPTPGFLGVAWSEPYRPLAVHEIRYTAAELGETAALGSGLVFTAIASGGEFEDQLYATGVLDRLRVNGAPAVVSTVFGGNATLAWEVSPGIVAYVGYSGAELDGDAVAALTRIAERTDTLSAGQWAALSPTYSLQRN